MQRIVLFIKDSRGSMVALTAFLMFVAVGVLALVIDLGHVQAVRNELANAADSGALAGCRALFPLDNYPALAPANDPPFCFIPGGAVDTALKTALLNKTDFKGIEVADADVVLGWWDWNNDGPFIPRPGVCALDQINAIRVITKRSEDLSQGSVIMGFAKALGFDTMNLQASSVAAVSYVRELGPNPYILWTTRERWNSIIPDPAEIGNSGLSTAQQDKIDNISFASPIQAPINMDWLRDTITNNAMTYKGEDLSIPYGTDPSVNLLNGVLGAAIEKAIRGQFKTHTLSDGTQITGYLTGIMIGERTDDVNDPNKMNREGSVQEAWPIIITDILNPGQSEDNSWTIEFTIIKDKVVDSQSPGGGPVSQIYASRPKIVHTDSNLIVKK